MTDDNTYNVSKIDTRVREAATKWIINKSNAPAFCDKFIFEYLEQAFIAGVNWERERSKKMIEAIKAALRQGIAHYEECSSLYGEDDECDCGGDATEN